MLPLRRVASGNAMPHWLFIEAVAIETMEENSNCTHVVKSAYDGDASTPGHLI